jgi:acylphosphatase
MAQVIARRFTVQGRVQGVGYRWFARQEAEALRIRGYVRNLRNGDVEVYAIGAPETLEQLRAILEQGPFGARVTAVQEQEAPLEPHSSFEITF